MGELPNNYMEGGINPALQIGTKNFRLFSASFRLNSLHQHRFASQKLACDLEFHKINPSRQTVAVDSDVM